MKSPECERQDHEWCGGPSRGTTCECRCHGEAKVGARDVWRGTSSGPAGVASAPTIAGVLWVLAWLALAAGVIAGFALDTNRFVDPGAGTAARIAVFAYGIGGFCLLAGVASILNLLVAIYLRLDKR